MNKCIVVLSGFLIAFWLYTPLPEDAQEPWKLRLVLIAIKLNNLISKTGELLGLDSALNITRRLAESRHRGRSLSDPDLQITNRFFDGVPVRIYRPKDLVGKTPGIVYIHGGGFSMFSIDSYDHVCRALAKKSRILLVSVGYRLAPEHPFPAALEDCLGAISYLYNHSDELQVDSERIGVAGDSAGATLAMAVTLNLTNTRNKKRPKLKLQVLIYPAVQSLNFNTPSYLQYGSSDAPCFISKSRAISMWLNYAVGFSGHKFYQYLSENSHVPNEIQESVYAKYVNYSVLRHSDATEGHRTVSAELKSKITNPMISPLMASDDQLRALPQIYLLTVEYDVLKDDCFMLKKRLQSNNIYFVHRHLMGYSHGVLNFMDIFDGGHIAIGEIALYLQSNI